MDPAYTLQYELFEKKHWWHVARGELIASTIDRYVGNNPQPKWLDIGCGTGVLLESYPRIADRMGVEMDAGSVERAISKGLNVRPITDPADFNYAQYGEFDLITLCDVIEHIPQDAQAVAGVIDALRPGGIVLVTVPAMQSLWSAHDVRNHHCRRYSKRSLVALFDPARWELLRVTYFSTFLLPLIWPYRQFKRLTQGTDPAQAADDKKFGPPIIDRTFLGMFRAECRLLRAVPMPIGSSLLLVARRRI